MLWPDFARITKIDLLSLERKSPEPNGISSLVSVERFGKMDIHLSQSQLFRRSESAENRIMEARLLTLALGMVQVDHAFPKDLAAKINPGNLSTLKSKDIRFSIGLSLHRVLRRIWSPKSA